MKSSVRIKLVVAVGLFMILGSASFSFGQYVLRDFGSFHIGGRTAALRDLPVKEVTILKGAAPVRIDPNGDYAVEQMYAQYFIPMNQKAKYPLLMWHGGGLTGATWETKPDGQPGWMHYFLKAGHPVYVSDAVERGRASWAPYPQIFATEPIFRTKKEAWEYFRIGPKGSYETRTTYPGVLFPLDAFDQFCKQGVPRWASTNNAIQAAYDAMVQKVGDCVLMLHSQGGSFAFQAALNAPDKIKAVIAIEPSAAPPPGLELAKLKSIPILIIWGDYTNGPDLALGWPKFMTTLSAFAQDLRARGGHVDWIELPKMGIKGNDHMIMMDMNSDQIAAIIQEWMNKNGLMK